MRILIRHTAEWSAETLLSRLAAAQYTHVWVETDRELVERATGGDRGAVIYTVRSSPDEVRPVLERLRERESDSCLILVGPEAGAETVAALLRDGVYDYLVAPVKAGRIEEALREGLRTRAAFLEVHGLSARLKKANLELAQERDALQRWNDHLIRLNELGQSVSATRTVDEMIEVFADRLTQIVPFDGLTVRWHRPEGIWLRTAFAGGERDHAVRRLLPAHRDNPERSRASILELPLLSGTVCHGSLRIERMSVNGFEQAETKWLGIAATSLALAMSHLTLLQELEQLAIRDSLTNLLNRRAFDAILRRELHTAQRYQSPMCLVLTDIDHFKTVNDRFGHPSGDALLREVAGLLATSIRGSDIVTRYGGEEFALILPRTSAHAAVTLADRIRNRIARHVFVVGGSTVRLTMSFGVASYRQAASLTPEQLVAAADHALYKAKSSGRNLVVVDPAGDEQTLCRPAGRGAPHRRASTNRL